MIDEALGVRGVGRGEDEGTSGDALRGETVMDIVWRHKAEADVVGSWIAQWRNDLTIWENKTFRLRPMLLPGDGPVLRMRRWFQQFYPTAGEAAVLTS